VRLVGPFVGQDEVDVAERKRRQGLLRLRFHELAAKIGRLPSERAHRRYRELEGHGLERGDACSARNLARRSGEVGLRQRFALEQCLGMTDEDECCVGEPNASAGGLEERHAGFALENCELLRHRRGREAQSFGDGCDRAARVELMEETQPPEIEHSQVSLLISRN
jgi:hypothetical protein